MSRGVGLVQMESLALNQAGKMMVFAANGSMALAKKVVAHLGIDLGNSSVTRFSDGEINMRINETVRGADVFVIQSTSPPVNDNLMELLIMIDALRRSSAGRITAVVPYFGYARQDRRARSHDPISARLVADMISTAGADRILSVDLHCPQIQGFFRIPMDHLRGIYIFASHFKRYFKDMSEVAVVSPDFGSVSRSNAFADLLNVPMAIVDKRRPRDNESVIAHFIGNVQGKYAILVDDQLSTGGSLCNAARTVMEHGAKGVYAAVTHPVLCGNAVEQLNDSPLEEVVVLDTIDVPQHKLDACKKLHQLSVAGFVGEAIKCIHTSKSIGELFRVVGGYEDEY